MTCALLILSAALLYVSVRLIQSAFREIARAVDEARNDKGM